MNVYTIDKMSDQELVSAIIGLPPDSEACVRLASAMASEGWLSGLALSEVAREVGSVGGRRLQRLEASVELGRRALAARAARTTETITCAEDAARVVRPLLVGQEREHMLALALNTKNRLKRIIEISIGSGNASIVHPVPLFRELLAVSAASFVLVHNHPSQDPQPSACDLQLCRRITKCADLMGCECLDFLVIGGDEHVSLRDQGMM